MLPWSTCGHTQGLVRIAPAKQYRLQLHVTTNEQLSDGQEPPLTSELASDANGSCPFAGAVCWLPRDRLSRTRPKNYRYHPMYVIVRRAPEATAPAALLPRRARYTRSLPVDEPFRSAYPYGRESQARAATAHA